MYMESRSRFIVDPTLYIYSIHRPKEGSNFAYKFKYTSIFCMFGQQRLLFNNMYIHYAVIEVDVKTFKFQNFPACGGFYVIMRELRRGYSKLQYANGLFWVDYTFKAIFI